MGKVLRAIIRGTGRGLPAEALGNQFFTDYLDTTDEWIVTRTGIKQRYRATDGENTVDHGQAGFAHGAGRRRRHAR